MREPSVVPDNLNNQHKSAIPSSFRCADPAVWHVSKWFHVARYFDIDIAEKGPAALAKHLALSVNEVFPIAYDISDVATGLAEVIRGLVYAEPVARLSNAQRMELIFA